MSGRYLLDTNAIINLLKNEDVNFPVIDRAEVFFVSVITEIELLCYKDLAEEDETGIKELLNESCIINIDMKIKEEAIELKKKNTIKLPDAVICATAVVNNLTLVTDDERLFNIEGLNVIHLSDLINKFSTIDSTSFDRDS
jgi:predicted nucleic acid-binding protein